MKRYCTLILSFGLLNSLAFSSFAADSSLGKEKFETNCRSCHNLNKAEGISIGPALSGVEKRVPNKAWMLKWVNDPAGMIALKDPYAIKISDQYKPIVMTGFPALKQNDIDNILAYIADAPSTTTVKSYPTTQNQPTQTRPSEISSTYQFMIGFAIITFAAIILAVIRLIRLQYRAKGLNIKF